MADRFTGIIKLDCSFTMSFEFKEDSPDVMKWTERGAVDRAKYCTDVIISRAMERFQNNPEAWRMMPPGKLTITRKENG